MTDMVGILFVSVSFVLNFFLSKVLNKINYKVRMKVNPYERKRNYVSRLFYLNDYAFAFGAISANPRMARRKLPVRLNSTTALLLMRLYDPTEGVITYHGTDIRKYKLDEYHERMGV